MSTRKVPIKIDQKEYLKKYLSGDKVKKKRKAKHLNVKIIDDDISFVKSEIDEELLLTGEDAPQIVGEYVDDRPNGAPSKWRSIVPKEEKPDSDSMIKQETEFKSRRRYSSERKIKRESPLAGGKRLEKRDTTPDLSPVRRRRLSRDTSPPRSWRNEAQRNGGPHSPPPRRNLSGARSQQLDRSRSRDLSPQRRFRRHSPDKSPLRRRNLYESPLKNRANSPPTGRYDDSGDQSPPRRRTYQQSPPRNRVQSPLGRHNNNEPPRRFKRSRSRDQSPPKRFRRKSADLSPPRRCGFNQSPLRKRMISPHERPYRNPAPHTPPPARPRGGLNHSPPRKRTLSPQRSFKMPAPHTPRARGGFNQSPTRKQYRSPVGRRESPQRRRNSEAMSPRRGKQSPPRRPPRDSADRGSYSRSPTRIKREKYSTDLSPARRTSYRRASPPQSGPPRRSRFDKPQFDNSPSPPPTHKPKSITTLDGKRAGLQDAHSLKTETEERRHKEERMFANMSRDVSGRDAEVQVRNTGRRGQRGRDAKAEDPEVQRRKEEREQKKQELYERWGKGLKQIEDHRARLTEQEHESSKPLARYFNDEDLDRHLRAQERADDPMLEYMRRKKKEREQETNKSVLPVYEGSYPENRFGIRPGYRWDGVDRSNGYEKRWFDAQSEKRARQEEAYKYSVEDM